MSRVSDFRNRVAQVKLAMQLSHSNHIIHATYRALWAHLYQGGFKVAGAVDKDILYTVYTPFTREAVRSIISVGYFAFVLDPSSKNPKVLEPSTYVVASGDAMHLDSSQDTTLRVIFLNQDDCDLYRNSPPELFVQYAPTASGQLTCPAMSVIDMHDAIIEFTRLALLGDNINLRPKAWISAKEANKNPAVYHFLDSKDVDSSDVAQQRKTKKNRDNMHAYISEQNSIRARLQQEQKIPGTFTDTCISRTVEIDSATNDPSLMVEIAPGMDITNMGPTHLRSDLVHLIQLFDTRMCNALGIPAELLGVSTSRTSGVAASPETTRLWERIAEPYRDMLNIALAKAVEKTFTIQNAIKYKKTRDRSYLAPTRISLESSVSLEKLLILQPFMTATAFGKHASSLTGFAVSDFIKEPAKEPKPKDAILQHQ
jgi:hypothetical protein